VVNPSASGRVLTSALTFTSRAEAAERERERVRARAEAANRRAVAESEREAREGPAPVLMSEENREFVEAVLRRARGARLGRAEAGHDDDAAAAAAAERWTWARAGAGAARAALVARVQAAGFAATWAEAAVEAPEVLEVAAAGRGGAGALLAAALDWLCLHVPEHELPAAFDPRGTQLDVLVPVRGAGAEAPAAEAGAAAPTRALGRWGVGVSDARAATHAAGRAGGLWAAAVCVASALDAVVTAVCDGAGSGGAAPATATEGPTAAAAATAAADEELEALRAMYGDDLSVESVRDGGPPARLVSLPLAAVPGVRVEVLCAEGGAVAPYPASAP
jgi:hypothetical protein